MVYLLRSASQLSNQILGRATEAAILTAFLGLWLVRLITIMLMLIVNTNANTNTTANTNTKPLTLIIIIL
jgi:hypothetical protein